MEAVFKTPELVDLILGHFCVVPSNDSLDSSESRVHVSREDLQVTSDKEKRRTLYRMALTNRAISHTALAILWVTLDGALPLLKLVSALQYNETVKQWVLARSLAQTDFERLEYFSGIVKHIVLSNRRHLFGAIHPSAVFEICMMRRDKPLVPGLKTLWIDDYCDYGTLLLTETLKCVKIVHVHVHARDEEGENLPSPSVWNLLGLLPARAPFLEKLHVGSVPSSSNLPDILKLEHLKKLTFAIWWERHWFAIDASSRYQFLKGLERLPQLRELDVGGLLEDYRSTIDPLMEPRTGCYRFSTLESLKITGFDEHLIKLLTQLPTSPLRELHFGLEMDGAWDGDFLDDYEEEGEEIEKFGIDQAFSFLGEHHFRSLTKLVIDSSFSVLEVEHLRPLLRVSGMRHVDLPRCWDLNDEFILEMASAWSDLECFQVFGNWHEPPLAQPTLLSLQTFARLCPNLRRISTDVDPNATAVLPDQPPHRLEHLTLFSVGENVKIAKSRVPVVAKFLSATFPALMFASCRYGSGEDTKGRDWNTVFRMVMHDKDKDKVAALKKMF